MAGSSGPGSVISYCNEIARFKKNSIRVVLVADPTAGGGSGGGVAYEGWHRRMWLAVLKIERAPLGMCDPRPEMSAPIRQSGSLALLE